jgi:hypothetical protein
MTYRYACMKWLGSAGLLMVMGGCPGGDDGDTGVTTFPTPPTTSVGTDTSAGEESTTTADPMTTMPEETTGDMDTSGGVACDLPCEAGQQCVNGNCFDMPGEDSTTGEPPPTGSDYGPCDMCAAGEMPVAIMGLDGFCFCSPECDGMTCAAPSEGTAMPVCALGFKMGQPPTQCALVCTTTEECPMGASCENLGMASICSFPVPM